MNTPAEISNADGTNPSHDPLCPRPGNPPWDCQCELIAKVRADERGRAISDLEDLAEAMRNLSGPEAQAAFAAAPEITMGDWLWAQRGVHRSIGELRTPLTSLMRTPTTCAHTKYVGCPPCPCEEPEIDTLRTSCERGCRDGLVRVLSFDGENTEVDLCPCQTK